MTSSEGVARSTRGEALCLSLDHPLISASGLSSFLRTLQAALREVGRTLPQVGHTFQEAGGPRLVFARIQGDHPLECEFLFAAPASSAYLEDVSRQAFGAFMVALISVMRQSSQRTLFGERIRRPLGKEGPLPPEAMERIGQVEREMGRFTRATVGYGGYRVVMDSGMVEITEPPGGAG